MKLNLIGPFQVNAPFGTEIAFAKGLRQLGVTVVEIDPNVDTRLNSLHDGADATIVFKSCVGHEEELRNSLPPVIVYQPDDARFPHIREMMMLMRGYSDLFLSFDRYGADVAKTMGYRVAEELLLTADPELYSPSPSPIERDIDVSFIGSLGDPVAHASRRKMCTLVQNEAIKRGWKTHFEQTQDIQRVVDIYRRSKVVLNHATDVGQPFGFGFGLQCRHFEVSMTGTCLLSNSRPLSLISPYFGLEFDSEEILIDRLNTLLDPTKGGEYLNEGEWIPLWDLLGRGNLAEVQRSHMPFHRAQKIVDFVVSNA